MQSAPAFQALQSFTAMDVGPVAKSASGVGQIQRFCGGSKAPGADRDPGGGGWQAIGGGGGGGGGPESVGEARGFQHIGTR